MAQVMPGWAMVLDDEFNQTNVNSVFDQNSLWISGQEWGQGNAIAGSNGGTYNSPVPAWNPLPSGCQQPAINTSFQTPGVLTLTMRKNPGAYADSTYPNGVLVRVCDPYTFTGAEIASKQRFRYGYFEIRAKVPNQGKLLWPAFWLWRGGGPNYREIDIFEFSDPTAGKMLTNVHLAKGIDGGPASSSTWNNYPGSNVIGQDITGVFHTYAMKWSPNSVAWYVDGQQVRILAGHSPHLEMNVTLDMWAALGSGGNPDSVLPANFNIDYVRAYRSLANEFMWQWGNAGSGQIHWWNMHPTDRYLSGRFASAAKGDILALSGGGWSQLMLFNGAAWDTPWANNGSGQIHWWNMHAQDQYLVGDFAGIGRDQLLAVDPANGWAHLMTYDAGASAWSTPWGNSGSGQIANWIVHPGDQYVAGDFDGDGRAEVLAVGANGWAQLLKYGSGGWTTVWSNGGSGSIAGWPLHSASDKYLAGDFDGGSAKELMAVDNGVFGQAAMLRYSAGVWSRVWGNNGSGQIHWWNMHAGDSYLVGRFDGLSHDQLMAVSTTGWSQLMTYAGSDWATPWANDGGGTIDLWSMKPADRYLAGDFNGHGRADLFALASNGWTHLLQRTLPQ